MGLLENADMSVVTFLLCQVWQFLLNSFRRYVSCVCATFLLN